MFKPDSQTISTAVVDAVIVGSMFVIAAPKNLEWIALPLGSFVICISIHLTRIKNAIQEKNDPPPHKK